MRKGLGHSEPFGKRKRQTYLRSTRKPPRTTPQNMGHAAKMQAERNTVRGRRSTRKTTAHTGPYTPEHFEGHNRQGKRVRPGGPTKEND